MAPAQWYTLIRFHQSPQQLTGVSQGRTAHEALELLSAWETQYSAETTVVFDPQNRPVTRDALASLAAGLRPLR